MKFPVHDTVCRSPAQDAEYKRDEKGQFTSGGGGGASSKSPSFPEYATGHFGSNWVVARSTAANKVRHEGATFVTPKQMSEVKERYKQEHPEAHAAYFGKSVHQD